MKARRIVWPVAERAELEDFELSSPAPDTVLIETHYSVISAGTEKAWLLGKPNTGGAFPQYPGYSAAGRLLEVGTQVEGLKAGDRVVAYHSGHASHALKHPRDVVRIPDDGIDSAEAAFTVIGSMSLQGVRKARLELGESVLVMGQGLLGLFATQLARLNGGAPVIALDFVEERRRLALSLGADYARSPDAEDLDAMVRSWTGGQGAGAIIEVTGNPVAMRQALALAARQGRVVILGCSREKTSGIDFYRDVHKTGVAIIGAHNCIRPAKDSYPGYWTLRDDLQTLLRLLAAGRLQVRPMISERARPEQAPALYRRLIESQSPPLGIVFAWQDSEGH